MTRYLFFLFLWISGCDFPTIQMQNETSVPKTNKSETWLVNLKTTGRISSNHFSDFVLDKSGNTYLSSFEKSPLVGDQILILKISPSGKILWEKGMHSIGRATATGIDQNENIWVTGFYKKQLKFDTLHIFAHEGSSSFLAKFNSEGKCLLLLDLAPNATPFHCHINSKNELLLAGNFSDTLSFGNISIVDNNGSTFFTKMDLNGNFHWIKSCSGNIRMVDSDAQGNFYLTGNFYKKFQLEGKKLRTQNDWDNDGFLLKINSEGQLQWLKKFGNKGFTKNGYRTPEGGQALVVDKKEVWVAARFSTINPDGADSDIHLSHQISTNKILKFSPDGKLQNEKTIFQSASDASAFAMTKTASGEIWCSGNAQGKTKILEEEFDFEKSNSFLIQMDSAFQKKKIIIPQHGSNTLFRVTKSVGDQVWWSGHFQERLTFQNQRITNDGKHSIFLLKH